VKLIPFLPVPVVVLVLGALRPAILTAGFESWRAFVVMAGVGVVGLVVLAAGWRRWRWRSVWAADAVVLLLVLAVVWPAFRVRTLEEDFPPVAAAATEPTTAPTATETLAPTRAPTAPARAVSPSASPSASLSASPSASPAASPKGSPKAAEPVAVRLGSGALEGIDHHAEGTVAVYRVGSELVLRFEGVDIEGTPTPSVHVVPAGQRDPDGGRRLGGLKAERGSFSYALPAGTDVRSVLVWCDRYAVPIAAADLRPA